MTSNIKKIAIVGAGGHIGKNFLEQLLKTNKHEITAITREGSNLSVPSNVKVAKIDYNNEDSIVQALQGQQFLIITLPGTAPPETHSKLVRSAAKAGVSYVMPNVYGFDVTNDALAKDIPITRVYPGYISDIEGHGMSWVAMVCGFWYEWSIAMGEPGFGIDVTSKKATFFDDGNTVINVSTWEHCGRAVATLLSLPESGADVSLANWKNKPLYISSFRVSQRDMLDSIHRVTGTSDADWEITYEKSDERYKKGVEDMQKGDRLGFARHMYTRVMYPNGDGEFESTKGLANKALSLPEEKLDEATKRTIEMVESGWVPF